MNAKNNNSSGNLYNKITHNIHQSTQKGINHSKLSKQNMIQQKQKSIINSKKQPINCTIKNIHKLLVFLKQSKLNTTIEKSLINNLNFYLVLLNNLNQSKQSKVQSNNLNNKNNHVNNPIEKEKRTVKAKILEQVEINKNLKIKTQKADKSDKFSGKNIKTQLKQNENKFSLPKINEKTINQNSESILNKNKNQRSTYKPLKQQYFNKQQNQKKITQKQRYQTQTGLNESILKNKTNKIYKDQEKGLLKSLSTSKVQNRQVIKVDYKQKVDNKQQKVLQGLKQKLNSHIILVQQLQRKIKQFEQSHQQLKNQNYQVKQIRIKKELDIIKENNKQNSDKTKRNNKYQQNHDQIGALKQQLRQRQQQIRNLWILIHQYNIPIKKPTKIN